MSSEIFDQLIGIDLGSFGSAAVACEHAKPGSIPRIDLIKPSDGCTQTTDYTKSKNLSALLLNRETKDVDCWGFKAEEKYSQLTVLCSMSCYSTKEKKEKSGSVFYQYIYKYSQKNGANALKGTKFRSMKIKDNSDTFEMPVTSLFTLMLNSIKETALAQVEVTRKNAFGEAYRPLDPKKVLYVLTVPALWDDEVNLKRKKKYITCISVF
ncbi:hypothetical protein RFI_38742 [Reticulomyxa filosa]|uniref:Uncharacterized protein n=1 Tax=Reticulomyxa filosa TaxID=46433 RepID=X6LC83_RETFI|nr:hypothetical protein RFI_38742 [Reticulomyxa filosa]|eukprot:ETN98746.1 hypothetical protein RFI_38742 [Reticulomyxa filosa]